MLMRQRLIRKSLLPEIDAKHKQIVSYWRGGCSHGVNVYRWKGKRLN